MKRKWRFLAAAAAAAALSLCFFGVRLRIAPRWILSRALGAALTQLDTRFENSPAWMLGSALDREGRQKASVQVETQTERLGCVRYDMDLQTQLNPCRVKAGGTVVTGGKILDLTVYLDQNFAAVSSRDLLDGKFYGIRYDRFSRDIRRRELLAALIGEKIIQQWEETVSSLQESYSLKFTPPKFSPGDIPGMLYGLLALEPRVGREEILISGKQELAYTVSFRATGQEIAAMAESYLDQLDPALSSLIRDLESTPDTAVSAVFYLREEKLVMIAADLDFSENSVRIRAELGQAPAEEPLYLELELQAGENLTRYTMSVDTKSDEAHYAETISLTQDRNGILNSGYLDYDWDLSSGEMILSLLVSDRKADLRLNLAGEGESVTIRTQNAASVLNLFLQKPLNDPVICTLNLSPGSMVAVPEYRSLDQWSMEDIFALLTGFGGLLGLKMP